MLTLYFKFVVGFFLITISKPQQISLFHGALFTKLTNVVLYESTIPLSFYIPKPDPSLLKIPRTKQTHNSICPFPLTKECVLFNQIQKFGDLIFEQREREIQTNNVAHGERKKRALDFIGSTLNWCCGVATDQELGSFVKTEGDITKHLGNLQEFVHAEHKDLVNDTRKINNMMKNVQRLVTGMQLDIGHWQNTFKQMEENEKGNMTINLLKIHLRTTIMMYAIALSQDYTNIKQECNNQLLSSKVIEKQELKEQLTKLRTKLEEKKYTLAIQSADELYNLHLTTCIFTDTGILVTTKIPIRKNQPTTLYHLQAIPLYWKGHTCKLVNQHHLLIKQGNQLKTLNMEEEKDCDFKRRGICAIPRARMSETTITDITHACLLGLISEDEVSKLQESCEFDCARSDNYTQITKLKEDSYLIHNVKPDTVIACEKATVKIPTNSTGTLALNVPCNCELREKDNVLISTIFPCDSRSNPHPNITQYIPIMWTNLPKLSMPVFENKELPSFFNISNVLNENWNLNISNLEVNNLFSEDVFSKVDMPSVFELFAGNNKVFFVIVIVWQIILTIIILYFIIKQSCKNLPTRDYPGWESN